jgi:hypothetical protein
MKTAFLAALIILFLCEPIQAADKILRIGFPDLAAQFVPLPLGEKRGFFKEESILRRIHPYKARHLVGGHD